MAIRGIPDRAAGVQLHVTSLPGGRLGEPARDFVRWLSAAGQTVWQVLPLTVPDAHGSPYASPSAFAAWPGLLEDPDADAAAVVRSEVAPGLDLLPAHPALEAVGVSLAAQGGLVTGTLGCGSAGVVGHPYNGPVTRLCVMSVALRDLGVGVRLRTSASTSTYTGRYRVSGGTRTRVTTALEVQPGWSLGLCPSA